MMFLVLEIIIFLVLALLLGTLLGFLLSRSMVRDVRTGVEQLKIDVAAARKRMSAAETDLQLHKSSLTELRAAYDGLQERLSVHSDRQADLSGQMEGLVAARSALSERTATLASQLTEGQAGLGRQLESAQHDLLLRIDELSGDQDLNAQRLVTLETTTDGLSYDLQRLGRRLDQDHPTTFERRAELAADLGDPADVAALAANADDALSALVARQAATDRQVAGLQHEVEALADADSALSVRLDAVVGLPNQVTTLDESQQDLEARVRSLEELPAQVESAQGQFERMQSTAAALTSRLEHQDRWGQETDERIEALEGQVTGREPRPTAPLTAAMAKPAASPAEAPMKMSAAETESTAESDDALPMDNLKRIRGVGVTLERALHKAGIVRFEQIAAWSLQDIQDLSGALQKYQQRIVRDNWVAQAKSLIAADEQEYKNGRRPPRVTPESSPTVEC